MKYIKMLFLFLFPIVRLAVIQVAADTLNRVAYPDRQVRRVPVDYRRKTYGPYGPNQKRQAATYATTTETGEFHDVLMVAFDLKGRSSEQVHHWLHSQMPVCDSYPYDITLDSWWVANDQRFDGSDCDSAVFVAKGNQGVARKLLRENNLLL